MDLFRNNGIDFQTQANDCQKKKKNGSDKNSKIYQ